MALHRAGVPSEKVTKIECLNHAIKNYTTRLYKIKCLSVQARKLMNGGTIKQLTVGARKAIAHNSKVKEPIDLLKKDLINSPKHVFGDHTSCRNYFCTKEESKDLNGFRLECHNFTKECLRPLLRKCSMLIPNETSNLAESFMAMVVKHIGGKQINRGKRGSYYHRTQSAGLAYQDGPLWHYLSLKKLIGKSPAGIVKKFGTTRERRNKRKLQYEKTYPKKRKIDATHARSNEDYGELCHSLDMEEEELNQAKAKKLDELSEDIVNIEKTTRGQSCNEKWHVQRKDRLTSSYFGSVVKTREKTPWGRLIRNILYSTFEGNAATQYGEIHEKDAIEAFEKISGLKVKMCGLFVDFERPYLGASPDGLTEDAVVEVKCPITLKDMTIEEATNKSSFFLDKNKTLKKSHNYFYQIMGQMAICQKKKGFFIVWSPTEFLYHEIEFDEDLWNKKMLPKLDNFYNNYLLKEIVDSRVVRGLSPRDKN